MNFWTGLILGLIIGWVIEWIIDWLFWRRDAAESGEMDAHVKERLLMAESSVEQLDVEWQSRLSAAEEDYHTRLAAVEQEWQARLNLNEQQWQTQFAELEADRNHLQSRLAEALVGAGLVGVGAAAVATEPEAAEPVEEEDIDELDARYEAMDTVAEPDRDVTAAADLVAEPDSEIDTGLEAQIEVGFDAEVDTALEAAIAGVGLEMAGRTSDESLVVEVEDEVDSEVHRVTTMPDMSIPGLAGREWDDLTRIHGIGPKYAGILSESGFGTFAALAAASPDDLRAAIDPAPRQQINFDSWIAQAAAFDQVRATTPGDDLTMLEGIGPVYATRLRENGITTFVELAAADETRLAEIIDAPAWRRINYQDWIEQAQLAAAGDNAGLKTVQDQLFRREGENLLLIRGLGERSAAALQVAGISTFAALAAATPQQLDAIISNAGVRGEFDYESWITEATLRGAGRRITRERPVATHVVSCPQDLSAVEGIGTVYEDRLYGAGIGSYWELAETAAAEIASILGLSSFQEVDLTAVKNSAMLLAVETGTIGHSWDGTPPDNFEMLAGLGEVYERRLYAAGICTFDALAAATPEQLADICQAPPMRMPDYNAWIAKASEMVAARRSG